MQGEKWDYTEAEHQPLQDFKTDHNSIRMELCKILLVRLYSNESGYVN
jgi:hypothetical protein